MKNLSQNQAKEIIKEKLNFDYLCNNTSIFYNPIGGKELDRYTVDVIKKNLQLFMNSWTQEAVDALKLSKI